MPRFSAIFPALVAVGLLAGCALPQHVQHTVMPASGWSFAEGVTYVALHLPAGAEARPVGLNILCDLKPGDVYRMAERRYTVVCDPSGMPGDDRSARFGSLRANWDNDRRLRLSDGTLLYVSVLNRWLRSAGNYEPVLAGRYAIGTFAVENYRRFYLRQPEQTVLDVTPGAIHVLGRVDGPDFVPADAGEIAALIAREFPGLAPGRLRSEAARNMRIHCEEKLALETILTLRTITECRAAPAG